MSVGIDQEIDPVCVQEVEPRQCHAECFASLGGEVVCLWSGVGVIGNMDCNAVHEVSGSGGLGTTSVYDEIVPPSNPVFDVPSKFNTKESLSRSPSPSPPSVQDLVLKPSPPYSRTYGPTEKLTRDKSVSYDFVYLPVKDCSSWSTNHFYSERRNSL